ncbi:MAG: hypothetical protein AAGB04_17480 [Pseudomonadota bacterium]
MTGGTLAGPGLYAMDTPNCAPEHLTALAAAGCQLMLFTTGVGNGFVSGLAPTLKICANQQSCRMLQTQIDIPLSEGPNGSLRLPDSASRTHDAMKATADGQLTWGETASDGDDIISRFGAVR